MPRQNDYSLRGSQNLSVSRLRTTTYGLRRIRYEGTRLWNRLYVNLKATESIHGFRSVINTWNGPTYAYNVCKHFSVCKNGTERKHYHD